MVGGLDDTYLVCYHFQFFVICIFEKHSFYIFIKVMGKSCQAPQGRFMHPGGGD